MQSLQVRWWWDLEASEFGLEGLPEVVGESSRGMMVEFVKQVHLQKEVGAGGGGRIC